MGTSNLHPFLRRRGPSMRWIVSVGRAGLAAAAVSLFAIPAAFAQGVTTGAIAGSVRDSTGGPLGGVRVVALHGPSGPPLPSGPPAGGAFPEPGLARGG